MSWASECRKNWPQYVAKGVDMMDCVLPSRNARNGCLFTSEGKVLIKQAQYADDDEPARPRLRLLHLPDVYAGLSSPPVSGEGNSVFHARNAAQRSSFP